MQLAILQTKSGRGLEGTTISSINEGSMPMEEEEVVAAILFTVTQPGDVAETMMTSQPGLSKCYNRHVVYLVRLWPTQIWQTIHKEEAMMLTQATVLVWLPMGADMFVLKIKVDGDQGQCPRLSPSPAEALIQHSHIPQQFLQVLSQIVR